MLKRERKRSLIPSIPNSPSQPSFFFFSSSCFQYSIYKLHNFLSVSVFSFIAICCFQIISHLSSFRKKEVAEPIVSGVLTRIGDLLIQESNLLYGVSDQVQLKPMQGLLKDADARQDEFFQWVAETRDLAYDAEDIIATYALKVASRQEGGVLKRCACILYEGITYVVWVVQERPLLPRWFTITLAILDDIWTIEAWNSLCEAFPKKNTGSKILLTSRNKDVSLHADPRGFLHELQHLNDKWSLELLEKIISHRKGTSNIQSYFINFSFLVVNLKTIFLFFCN